MIIDMQQPFAADGLIVFPDFVFTNKSKPQSEVGETFAILVSTQGADFSVTGVADNENQLG